MTLDDLLSHLERVRRSGNGFIALCPAHDDRKHSLSITQADDRILLHCFVDCGIDEICDALGIRVKDLFGANGANTSNTQRYSDQRRLEYAERIWRRATKPAAGTTVERYLRNRGITLSVPAAIRFCTLTHDDWPRAMHWPALAAGIQDGNGKFTGVAVTGLTADGSSKMPVEDPRRIYGPYRGGAVRLSSQFNSQLAIGEGIETMFSVQQATGIPSWAALSASNLPYVQLPASIREVTVCADADPRGESAAQCLAGRLIGEGRQVRIARPAQFGMDFNDLRL
jgi:hypothetical protein